MDPHPLDDPVRASLTGAHAPVAQRRGSALRYAPDVTPFSAPPADEQGWDDLAALLGPGATTVVPTLHPTVPPGWELVRELPGVQLVDAGLVPREDPAALVLGPADVPEMIDLVERTNPGPFLTRTIVLGRYLGFREHGAHGPLVALAGERLHPPGWTEISAVCTDPAHRGRGLASRLVRAVAAGVRERGGTPFLHTGAHNTRAVRLYEELGFRLRARPSFVALRAPDPAIGHPVRTAPTSTGATRP